MKQDENYQNEDIVSANREDYLNKRTTDIRKIWGMAKEDFLALALVVLLGLNVYLVTVIIGAYKELTTQRVNDLKEFTKQEISTQLEPVQQEVKETTSQVKSTINDFKEKVVTESEAETKEE